MENTKDLEVPMPEPDGWLFVSHSETLNGVSEAPEERPAWQYTLRHMGGLKPYLTQRQYEAQSPAIQKWYEPVSSQQERAFTLTKMRTYGAVCFSDGYVAGIKAENARCRQILTDKREHYDALPDRALAAQCFDHAQILLGGLAYEAALRGKVK